MTTEGVRRITRLPTESRNVTRAEGGAYPLNERCAAPGCGGMPVERHHLYRRSFIIGDAWWVTMPDGRVVGNCCGLCQGCHAEVTNNAAWIEYDGERFLWNNMIEAALPLTWQPPMGEVPAPHEHLENECPTCHRAMPKPKIDNPSEAKRIRKSWTITVPKDHLEDGAAVLDELLEGIREEMGKRGMSYSESARYFVLSTALALLLTNIEEVLS